jgi:hypothetical protein
MNSDLFEKNIGRLVKQSALPLTDERRDRARAAFLRAAEASASRSRLRLIGIAAAVLIFFGVVYETTTRPLPKLPPAPVDSAVSKQQTEAAAWTDVLGDGGSTLIQGSLLMSGPSRSGPFARKVVFKVGSSLPDGFTFRLRIEAMEEQLRGAVLVSKPRTLFPVQPVLDHGGFETDWDLVAPAPLSIDVSTPDSLQDRTVLEQTKLAEGARTALFHYSPWDDGLLRRLEPQLAELADFAREGRELVARVEAACATEARFKAEEKQLTADAGRLQARVEGFAANGLYPAAARILSYTFRDLATSMAIFKWKDGKLEGPVSYYTNGKPGTLFRGDPFAFDALRRYLDDAVLVSGREFDLWILRDFRRAGPREALVAAVEESKKRPGVAEFAEALKALAAPPGTLPPTLEDEIRKISK